MASGDPHGPNKWSNYIAAHEKIMGRFVDTGFIAEDTLQIYPVGGNLIVITGKLACLGDVRLDVEKALKVISGEGMNALVQTVEYSYNASLPTGNILRYDSPHGDGHNNFHHVHRFDVFQGDGIGEISSCEWPTLGQVMDELQGWVYDNYDRLHPTHVLGSESRAED